MLLLALSTGLCVQVLVLLTLSGGDPVDALSYWMTNPATPYNRVEFAYGYPPIAAQLAAPLFQMPFPAFAFLLRLLEVASLVFVTGPLAGALIFTTPVASEARCSIAGAVMEATSLVAASFRSRDWDCRWRRA